MCNRQLSGLLKDKGIGLVTEFNTGEVDGTGGRLVSFDGREIGFDLAVVIPLDGGQSYVDRSPGLGDELGFVPADQRTTRAAIGTLQMRLAYPSDKPTVSRVVDTRCDEARVAVLAWR